jgi:hypothetical protein
MWLGVAGFTVIVVLMSRRVNGAIMLGILFTTFISWIPGHGASYLGSDTDIPGVCGTEGVLTWRSGCTLPWARFWRLVTLTAHSGSPSSPPAASGRRSKAAAAASRPSGARC